MRDLEMLVKEFKFYHDIDKKLHTTIRVRGWYKSLSKAERKTLTTYLKSIVNTISGGTLSFIELGQDMIKGINSGVVK